MTAIFGVLGKLSEETILAGIVLVGLAIRLAAIVLYPNVPDSDETAYIAMASSFIAGNGIVDHLGNFAMYNMGYPVFFVAPILATFGGKLLAVKFGNAVLGSIAVVMCHAVAKRAGADRNARLLAAMLWALYLPAGLYTVYILKENLLIPVMLGVIWCALGFATRVTLRNAALCGLLFGLVALTGNAALTLALPVAAALLFNSGTRMIKLKAAAIIIGIALAVSAPWTVRNAQVLGAPVLNTNGGFNLYLGNNPQATGMFVSIADTPRGADWHALRLTGEVHASDTLKADAIAWIRNHPSAFIGLALKKLQFFWTPPLHSGQGTPSTIEKMIRIVWAAQFFVLVIAAIGGAVVVFRESARHATVLCLAVASYTGVHMIFYVIFRYREPIMPVLCVLAAIGLSQVWRLAMRRTAAPPKSVAPAS